ncbi:2,3-bisphosphoglycerate-independent phosphoglycerate mutase [Tanacetum coccineum]
MILDAVEQMDRIYVVTVDHGNAEDMVKRNKKGEPILKDGEVQILTSHTLQPVPVAIGGLGLSAGVRFRKDVPSGGLANVAANVMNLHGFVAPEDYETTLMEVSLSGTPKEAITLSEMPSAAEERDMSSVLSIY